MRVVVRPPGIRFDLVSESLFPAGFAEQYGSVFATPGIAEKGHFDVHVEVTAPGGHSSIPPKHTVRFSMNAPDRLNFSRSARALGFLQHFSSSMRHIQPERTS